MVLCHWDYVRTKSIKKTDWNKVPMWACYVCRALLAYVWLRGGCEGPLFIHEDGSPLSRKSFQDRLKELLLEAGVSGDYTSHSLRIGAATTAAALGIPDRMIRTMGRWASDAYMIYVRTPMSTWARTSASLSRASV